MTTLTADVADAASLVREHLGGCHPRIAIILGSGLGQLTEGIERATNIRSFDGCSAMSPGTSMAALPSTRSLRSSLRTFPAPMSVTYQALPSGSIRIV